MKKLLLCLLLLSVLLPCASAHGGKTDANGGHYNKKTGEYHYHHGYPAHQHPNGVCPYNYDDQTDHSNRGTSSNSTTASSGSIAAAVSNSSSKTSSVANEQDRQEAAKANYEKGYSEGYTAASKKFDDGITQEDVDSAVNEISEKMSSEKARSFNSGYQSAVDKWKWYFGGACLAFLLMVAAFWYIRKELLSQQKSLQLIENENNKLKSQLSAVDQQYLQSQKLLQEKDDELKAQRRQIASLKTSIQRTLHALDTSGHSQVSFPNEYILEEHPTRPETFEKVITFANWEPSVHLAKGQHERFMRARTEKMSICGMMKQYTIVRSASGKRYHVTLNTCDCYDFQKNLKCSRPCKHIYFLAMKSSIAVDDIFLK